MHLRLMIMFLRNTILVRYMNVGLTPRLFWVQSVRVIVLPKLSPIFLPDISMAAIVQLSEVARLFLGLFVLVRMNTALILKPLVLN